MSERIDLATARELLDFAAGATGGVVSDAVADEQLKGAVAIHNMLQDQNVAYLADEVGMGKTYVALGAMALLRHFRPELRVMVLAPKENIQTKWIKETRNFVNRVVRVEDLRVKAVGGHPARALVKVDSLVDLVTEASNDPDRDFFVRLTSFSLPTAGAEGALGRRKAQLLKALPWVSPDLINAQNKERYRRNFGRAVNCALPDIDLLIVDEAHNLKAGWKDGASSSVRNTVLGCALGGRRVEDEADAFRGYRRKIKKVLFLSATPIEDDIRQLWNQLDLFGFGAGWESLRDPKLDHDAQREVVRKLLIRRTAELTSGEQRLTKSEYRREWRAGGIATHDEALRPASDRQRLAVALVQKKVAEVLGSGEHNHSFQAGLLASFESFLETVRSTQTDEEPEEGSEAENDEQPIFYGPVEKPIAGDVRPQGADIEAINRVAKDHLKTFGTEMPHPKMDAIVDELARTFTNGRKALVFVRRVASVDELQRKLEERYDALLFDRLRSRLRGEGLRAEIDRQIKAYSEARVAGRHEIKARSAPAVNAPDDTEQSSVDSFFAWFFRGKGPEGVRSGASIALDLEKASSAYSTLLEDNYVAWVLRAEPRDVVAELARALEVSVEAASTLVVAECGYHLPLKGAITSRLRMRAMQAGALTILSRVGGRIGEESVVVLRDVFVNMIRDERGARAEPGDVSWLAEPTFFSELRSRPSLRELIWPTPRTEDFVAVLREQETRRELISTMLRKGHAIIDVFTIIANRLGSIRRGARELVEMALPALAAELLDELERQQREEPAAFNSFYELFETAKSFHLVLQLNAPEIREADVTRIPTILGKTLRAQRPVAGMAGKVNGEVVRQFRMPGYPLILVCTDLLKEGEDLHTFCSNVYHYGIAWMPSELEQRVGRVDRVGSQSERRLGEQNGVRVEDDLLQVYYPHLGDTVEVLQLRRVYERLNRFMRMMHEGLGTPPKERAEVNVADEGLRLHSDIAAIRTRLESAFKVTGPMLVGRTRSLASTTRDAAGMRARFDAIKELVESLTAEKVHHKDGNQLVGQIRLGSRVQPFTLILRSLRGRPLLRCVSPVGTYSILRQAEKDAWRLARLPYARLSVERNDRYESYDVAVEGDMVLGAPGTDGHRAETLLRAVVEAADLVEERILYKDASMDEMTAGLAAEVTVAR